jgi:flagellar motor switch protein FliM
VGSEATNTLLAMPRPLALALVAALMGDPGQALPADRELTVVEDSLFEYLLQQCFVPVLQETFTGGEPLVIRTSQKEPHPRYARVFAPDANVVACALMVRGPFGELVWWWLLPQKTVLGWFAACPSPAAETGPKMEALARELPVDLTVTLGSVELPLAEVARLRPGDLVMLNQRVADPLPASVAGEPKFRVWPGRAGSRRDES